jgi:hypothetical protein
MADGNLKFEGQDLTFNGEVLTFMGEQPPTPTDPITLRNNKYATATESGAVRFRRLVSLGYV